MHRRGGEQSGGKGVGSRKVRRQERGEEDRGRTWSRGHEDMKGAGMTE